MIMQQPDLLPDIPTLIKAALASDGASFGAIVRRYQQPLFGFLGRMGLAQAQAEDIAQEAFIRVWQNLHNYDPLRAQFSTWLFAIARNLALNDLASAKHTYEQTTAEELPDYESTNEPHPEILIAKQQSEALLAALRTLPHNDRSALALAYVNELDLASIARIEHCSLSVIKTRIHRAKLKLRDLLKETE
jgi:RNA polymerase sigma-70 factor, ECF subfamily